MLQGIQVAKEVAEQELSSQRAAFEGRIEALQAELVRAGGLLPSRPFLDGPLSDRWLWTGGCRPDQGPLWASVGSGPPLAGRSQEASLSTC